MNYKWTHKNQIQQQCIRVHLQTHLVSGWVPEIMKLKHAINLYLSVARIRQMLRLYYCLYLELEICTDLLNIDMSHIWGLKQHKNSWVNTKHAKINSECSALWQVLHWQFGIQSPPVKIFVKHACFVMIRNRLLKLNQFGLQGPLGNQLTVRVNR